jgi:hypothetical protein
MKGLALEELGEVEKSFLVLCHSSVTFRDKESHQYYIM